MYVLYFILYSFSQKIMLHALILSVHFLDFQGTNVTFLVLCIAISILCSYDVSCIM